ncbi:hypothetical protein MRB53_019076 [Persea americana]|uniref:Uncharacterized protein n=1 Tax=Persea americana TaxID=3435 RepID=A0ACC2M9Q0_PERAE|nr:hypothetical protein MRB53_019076 [Persea americana]
MAPRGYDHEDYQSPHTKKSVLTKVKEKARKWRNTLSKKKHGHDGASPTATPTPTRRVSLVEEGEEGAPEYHGAPLYESEQAPEDYKEAPTTQHSAPPVVIAEKHVLKARNNMGTATESKTLTQTAKDKMGTTTESRTLTQSAKDNMGTTTTTTESKTLTQSTNDVGVTGPACDQVSQTTQVITSKTHGPPVELMANTTDTTVVESSPTGTGQNWDKGVSVKEYLMQKLEPGEEEKALSRVISEAMSPGKLGNNGEMGVVDKVKEAVSSLLGIEEQHPKATVTINPNAEIIEEKEERILQTN